jgi:hypothetical protein
MSRAVAVSTRPTVAARCRSLVCAGLEPREAAALVAHADGIDRHLEGEELCNVTWRWQEIARLEFLRFLVTTGRLTDGPASATPPEGRR